MAPIVVYVHGNGNKVREDLLKRQWNDALFGQDMDASSRMAYWAPLRYPTPLPDPEFDEIELLPISPLEAAAPPEPVSSEAFLAETIREAHAEAAAEAATGTPEAATAARGTSEAASPDAATSHDATIPAQTARPAATVDAAALEAWLRAMTYAADALAEGESAMPPPSSSALEALPFPRPVRILAFRAMVKVTFKDVYAYFFGGLRERMRRVVRNALTGIDGPVIVVAHSLGSIIAHDVLRESGSSSLDVPLFVTVGSPLGVTEVQDLVERPLQVPVGVGAWRNVSDARDLVALDHTIRPEYNPAARCTDFFVVNDSGNHHGIREYLRTVPVRQPILQLFTQ